MGEKPAHRGQLSDNYSCSRNTERVFSCLYKLVLLTPAPSPLQPPGFLQRTQGGRGVTVSAADGGVGSECLLTGAVGVLFGVIRTSHQNLPSICMIMAYWAVPGK